MKGHSLWQPVSGAGDHPEELGHGVDEVEYLWDEEQEHGLGEVAEDARHGKGHPGKVAVRVAHKYPRGVPR